jgi:hypothetical protein
MLFIGAEKRAGNGDEYDLRKEIVKKGKSALEKM